MTGTQANVGSAQGRTGQRWRLLALFLVTLFFGALFQLAGPAATAATTGSGYLPFASGTSVYVYQANGSDPGCSTHCSQPDYYAWDFGTPNGSAAGMQVVSATSGTVIGFRNDYQGTCTDFWSACAFGNYVFVHNDDGTYLEYLHMQFGSVSVSQNQHVSVGTPIGKVGATGYTGGFAHLHFSWLTTARGTGSSLSVGNSAPGSFIGIGHPTTHHTYTSNNPGADYSFAVTSVSATTPDGTLNHTWLGAQGTLKVTVRNTGSKTWGADSIPIRLGTSAPNDRTSNLATTGWISTARAAQVSGQVPPGATYTFTFPYRVAVNNSYPYVEHFDLVAEGVQWFPDAGLQVPVGLTTTVDRAVVLRHHGTGGYTLAPDGTLSPFGGAPVLKSTAFWPGWSIARGLVLRSDDLGGYLLDGYGGIHPFGNAPALAASAYWPGWDIARGIVLRSDNRGGYVLDGFGGIHPFGNAPALSVSAYWPNWDIARAITLRPDNGGGYVLDGYGALHAFGNAPSMPVSAYWSGWDIARSVALTDARGGYVLDGFGGIHSFGDAPAVTTSAYWPNWDVAKAIALHSNGSGDVVDGAGGLHTITPTA